MNKRILFPLLAVMIALTTGRAEESKLSDFTDAVYVQSVTVPAGSQQTLSIQMKNSFSVQTIQFNLYLPEGLTVVRNEDNELITPSKARVKKFSFFESSVQPDGSIRLLAQATTTNIAIGEGEIATITVNINAGTTPGDYPVTVKNISIVSRDNEAKIIEEVTTMLTITEAGDGRITFNETATELPPYPEDEQVNVSVVRTIKANQWSTICLPFAMTTEQVKAAFGDDVELGDFMGYDIYEDTDENIVGITVNFNKVTAIEANHPYIIMVSKAMAEFTVDQVDIAPTEVPCVSFGYETGRRPVVYHPADFIGTYVADFDFYHDAQKQALFLSGNKFYYATENTQYMKAFRAYFDFDDVLDTSNDGSANVKMAVLMDGIETSVDGLGFNDTAGCLYDLSGRKVTKPQQRGFYIVNGKKAIIK